ncbi:SND2/TMEM208 family protein [Armatimonas sp.]|uniref:SND2/TMEM208 family protein n=1 Tax=Armatimonas sp. TaxID=1872638 RepID=UPI00286BD342|nr:SND2/TMEM208 family protein [Armatimonas sp.]
MSLILRLILIFVGLLAVFWLLAFVVGYLWYAIIAIGVVAVIALVVWMFTQNKAPQQRPPTQTKKQDKAAQKELQKLEQRQKNGPQ